MHILIGCLQTDQLSPEEIEGIAFNILNGKMEIQGVYPGDDYGVKTLEKQDETWDFIKYVEELYQKNKELAEKYNAAEQKICFLLENISDYDKQNLNKEFYDAFGEALCGDIDDIERNSFSINPMLQSFLTRMRAGRDDDYGWLEPNGTFHAVDFAEHQAWAENISKNI